MDHGDTAAPPSFGTFYRRHLLPVLRQLERQRLRRLPAVFGCFLAFHVLAACVTCFLLGAPGLTVIAAGEAVVLTLAVIAAAQLEWRGLSIGGSETMLLFSAALAALLLVTCLAFGHPAAKESVAAVLIPMLAAGALAETCQHRLLDTATRRTRFSQEVLAPLAAYCRPTLRQAPKTVFSLGSIMESGLLPAVNKYTCDACFSGEIDGCTLAFCQLLGLHETVTYRRGRTYREESRAFVGWFFRADLPWNFAGRMVVVPGSEEARNGWLGRTFLAAAIPSGLEQVPMAQPKFRRRFTVLASDATEARALFSPSVMTALVTAQTRLRAPISLACVHNQVYAACPSLFTYFGPFEPHSFTDPAYTRHLHAAIDGVARLAELIAHSRNPWWDGSVGISGSMT
ncbi:MAG: DUF3137 domain-containing protein [Planctomycetes bacterium]|nr:DUF3137 domain-containing protein [Planctomycetota bacterium]